MIMTQEEKAKRYNEALEIAKKNYIAAQDLYGYPIGVECFKNTLENIFPELKESEDELKDILIRVVKKVVQKKLEPYERSCIEETIRLLVEYFSDTLECSEEPCECCGDWIDTYTMEI